MKKLFLSMILLVLPLVAGAYNIAVDNADGITIYYNYINDGTELEVSSYSYSGVVNIPEEVTYMSHTRKVIRIGDYAFNNCDKLTSVSIPNSVINIGRYAFYQCINLTSVTIPNSVINIGYCAFHSCSSLTSVTIPNSITSIEGFVFRGCSSLTSVNVPNSITSIGGSAFRDCSGLTSVTIPNSVTSIGAYAFEGCTNLTSVAIPNSVTSIGEKAFFRCHGLTSVESKMENPCFIYSDCFLDDVFYNITLYVPKGTIDKYKSTDYWSKFLFIEETESGSTPDDTKCATPTISYADKKLTFSCETEGVEFVSKITDADIKDHNGNEISLTATYNISVYATKSGYTNSDVATATLVWTNAIFTETTPETPTSAKAIAESIPVLISANGGVITVKSEQEGQPVAVYTADGKALGSATVKDGQALINTSIQSGDIAVVKVGSRSVKVLMR